MSNGLGAGAPGGGNIDPGMLQRILSYLGIGSAQAGEAPRPVPDLPIPAGAVPPVNRGPGPGNVGPSIGFLPSAGMGGQGPGPGNVGQSINFLPSGGQTGPVGGESRIPLAGGQGIGSDVNRPVMGAAGFPGMYAAPGQQPAMPGPPISPVRTPAAARGGGARIPANARAQVPAATAAPAVNPGWGMIDRPNADIVGGPSVPGALAGRGGRGGGGPAQMGAFDFSKLFSQQG